MLAQLENWVENGVKPADQLTLTNRNPLPPYAVVASKPMCRYPLYPRYSASAPAAAARFLSTSASSSVPAPTTTPALPRQPLWPPA